MNFQFSTFLTFQEVLVKLNDRRNVPERGDAENYEKIGNLYKRKKINNVEINPTQIGEELSKLNNAFIDNNHNNSSGSQGIYLKKNDTKA